MPQKIVNAKVSTTDSERPSGVAFLRPVTREDLLRDTEHDPEGADELVALVRRLRQAVTDPVNR